MSVAAVVIGRNEGARLARCLKSLQVQLENIVYVDSGSWDESIREAEKLGVAIVELDNSTRFTAARARNAGMAYLAEHSPVDFVQVIDGDCEMQAGWIDKAVRFLEEHADIAAVAGRLCERDPDATLWNQLIDAEWNRPPGEAEAIGGTALLRVAAIDEVGGYNNDFIAGEEPEMCLRLRRKGWKIWRLADPMALHDAAMIHMRDWWNRCRRAGFAYALGNWEHGAGTEKYNRRETIRPILWGVGIPVFALLGTLVTPYSLFVLAIFPLQVLRLAASGHTWKRAVFLTLGKFPEAVGVIEHFYGRVVGRKRGLIEYKNLKAPQKAER